MAIKLFKDKKILILIILAIVFYVLSFFVGNSSPKEALPTTKVEYLDEKKLEKILSNIEGAGNVMVYITYKNSGKNNIAYDMKNDSTSQEINVKTVGKQGSNDIYVLSSEKPEISGVLVTATGADSLEMINKIKKCVKAATNVPYNKIEVAKGVK